MASGYFLIDVLPRSTNLVGVEIGCRDGATSEFLLREMPNLFLFGVDPYTPYVDWNEHVSTEQLQAYWIDELMRRVGAYPGRFKLFRETSDDAVRHFEDESLDFIFIDGLHTYEQVLADMRNYYPKIKSGGIFSGHDYEAIEGVRLAVDEFAGEMKISAVKKSSNDTWYWSKP